MLRQAPSVRSNYVVQRVRAHLLFSCVPFILIDSCVVCISCFMCTCEYSQGVKKLRAVAAHREDAHSLLVFWRGMKDLGLTAEFIAKGGTEFGFLSTSASKEVAVNFAVSQLPLIFKFETKDFTSRGADISFLSVYPGEKEALYPPLTYLRSVGMQKETVGGLEVVVATVEPVFM